MLSLAIHTLGCKLNQLESEAIAGAFKARGFQVLPWGAAADILVVNTCTVTSKAEQKARRIIRRALRDNPAACLLVTGCYAQLDGPSLAALEGEAVFTAPAEAPRHGRNRIVVLSGDLKSALLELPAYLCGGDFAGDPAELPALLERWRDGRAAGGGLGETRREPRGNPGVSPLEEPRGETPGGNPFAFKVEDFSFHSRAFLKIQDGCDHACSYCRVSLARGKSRSLDAREVLARLRALEDRGYGEAVLTGVNLNQYRDGQGRDGLGRDGLDLGGLLTLLLEGTRSIALRLSSLEPEGLSPEFLTVLANPRIRPHFHLSIQSGSRGILEKMRRRYTPEGIEAAVRRLRDLREDPFVACDLITGFPGERDEDFQATVDLCRRIGFAGIHAFPYSRRPGTEAFSFPNPVSEGEAVSRVNALLALAREGREAYIRRWLGKPLTAIVEASVRAPPGHAAAVTENYLKALLPQAGEGARIGTAPGMVLRCRLRAFAGGFPGGPDQAGFDALGEILS
jgi:threonylcarbamoyladenosine tRNA methylthiotransferase MtaB